MPSSKPKKVRADVLLVEQGLAESRSKAQALILAGQVRHKEERLDKAGTQLPPTAALSVVGQSRYVSRGGFKLESALDGLGLDPVGWVCADIGASTGGFSDCLLQRGAKQIYAVDVGQGLLANKLVQDERVVVMDKTNARFLDAASFPQAIDLVVVDASFIGIGKLVGAFAKILPCGAFLLAMVKPQFEVGREVAKRSKGVIRDATVRAGAIEQAKEQVSAAGFSILRGCDSGTPGPKGNVEYFLLAKRVANSAL